MVHRFHFGIKCLNLEMKRLKHPTIRVKNHINHIEVRSKVWVMSTRTMMTPRLVTPDLSMKSLLSEYD